MIKKRGKSFNVSDWKKYKTDFEQLKIENKDFKLIGLPFFNEGLREEFEKVFEEKLINLK